MSANGNNGGMRSDHNVIAPVKQELIEPSGDVVAQDVNFNRHIELVHAPVRVPNVATTALQSAPAVNNENDTGQFNYGQTETRIVAGAPSDINSPTSPSKVPLKIKSVRFTCAYCKKGFEHRCQLLVHTRIHTGEKPFECSVCDMRFRYNCQLQKHKGTHTVIHLYSCKACRLSFAKRDLMIDHQEKVHPISSQVENVDQHLVNGSVSAASNSHVNYSKKSLHVAHEYNTDISAQANLTAVENYFFALDNIDSSVGKLENQRRPSIPHNVINEDARVKHASSSNVILNNSYSRNVIHDKNVTPSFSNDMNVGKEVKRRHAPLETSDIANPEGGTKKPRKQRSQCATMPNDMHNSSAILSAAKSTREFSANSRLDARDENSFLVSPEINHSLNSTTGDFHEERSPAKMMNENALANNDEFSDADANTTIDLVSTSSSEDMNIGLVLKQEPALNEETATNGEPVQEFEEQSALENASTEVETAGSQFVALVEDLRTDASNDVLQQLADPLPVTSDNLVKLEQKPETHQNILHKKGYIDEELEKMYRTDPDGVFLVWSEKFSLDLAIAVARSGPNIALCVKKFSPTTLVDLCALVKTHHTSVVEIGPNSQSYRFFSFGGFVLPEKILSNGTFNSFHKLETTIRHFARSQGKKLVHIVNIFKEDVWHEAVVHDLQDDCIILANS